MGYDPLASVHITRPNASSEVIGTIPSTLIGFGLAYTGQDYTSLM